jgi:hypothetical protein
MAVLLGAAIFGAVVGILADKPDIYKHFLLR